MKEGKKIFKNLSECNRLAVRDGIHQSGEDLKAEGDILASLQKGISAGKT